MAEREHLVSSQPDQPQAASGDAYPAGTGSRSSGLYISRRGPAGAPARARRRGRGHGSGRRFGADAARHNLTAPAWRGP